MLLKQIVHILLKMYLLSKIYSVLNGTRNSIFKCFRRWNIFQSFSAEIPIKIILFLLNNSLVCQQRSFVCQQISWRFYNQLFCDQGDNFNLKKLPSSTLIVNVFGFPKSAFSVYYWFLDNFIQKIGWLILCFALSNILYPFNIFVSSFYFLSMRFFLSFFLSWVGVHVV